MKRVSYLVALIDIFMNIGLWTVNYLMFRWVETTHGWLVFYIDYPTWENLHYVTTGEQ